MAVFLIQAIIDAVEMKDDVHKWSGAHPISHRAGAYGANTDTLKALKKLNLEIDSSNFAEHNNCKIQLL